MSVLPFESFAIALCERRLLLYSPRKHIASVFEHNLPNYQCREKFRLGIIGDMAFHIMPFAADRFNAARCQRRFGDLVEREHTFIVILAHCQ
jgi:hypothetical protein